MSKIKMIRKDHIFETVEGDYAVAHDSRNWWIIIPITDGIVQYGSLDAVYVNGSYRDAVDYIPVVRQLEGDKQ